MRLALEKERVDRGWSKAELARRARMNPSTVGLVEAGRLVPYPTQIGRLARALGWQGQPEDLLADVEGTRDGGSTS